MHEHGNARADWRAPMAVLYWLASQEAMQRVAHPGPGQASEEAERLAAEVERYIETVG